MTGSWFLPSHSGSSGFLHVHMGANMTVVLITSLGSQSCKPPNTDYSGSALPFVKYTFVDSLTRFQVALGHVVPRAAPSCKRSLADSERQNIKRRFESFATKYIKSPLTSCAGDLSISPAPVDTHKPA